MKIRITITAVFLLIFLSGCEFSDIFGGDIHILAVGDIMMGRYVRVLMERSGDDYPFQKLSDEEQTLYPSYNIVLANLEGPIVEHPGPYRTDTNFGFAPNTAEIFKKHGFTMASLANNHTLDRGEKGLASTKKYLEETGISWFGHPRDEGTADVLIKKINGVRIAFVGFHDATRKLDQDLALQTIADARKKSDLVFVFIHWGAEYTHKANARQKELAHAFIDSGADIVVGHHPHVVQGVELYQNRPIVYSLGNFIFDQYFSQATQEGLALGIHIFPAQQKAELEFFPLKSVRSQIDFASGTEREQMLKKFAGYGEVPEVKDGKLTIGLKTP